MIGFFAYLGCAVLFIALAVYAMVSIEPVGIWANVKKKPNVSDVRGYNRAAAKLFFGYGAAIAICGLPMLFDANAAVTMLVCVLGVAAATIAMIIAAVKIEEKYKGRR